MPEKSFGKEGDQGDASSTQGIFPCTRVMSTLEKEKSSHLAAAEPRSPNSNLPTETHDPSGKAFSSSAPELKRPEVVSFPPLPARKETTDWISPLPDLSVFTFPDTSGSLYTDGIDAQLSITKRVSTSSLLNLRSWEPETREPEPREDSSAEESLTRSKSTSLLYPQVLLPAEESTVRRKSAVPLHPRVVARTGDSFKLGSAIGSSCGTRRKSSDRSIRLRIAEEALERHYHQDQTSWTKPRKDSGWPAHMSPSPESIHSRKASSEVSAPPHKLMRMNIEKDKMRQDDRSNLIEGLVPLLSKVDHVGIYDNLTGAKKDNMKCETPCVGHVWRVGFWDSES